MDTRPVFRGDPRDMSALEAYERELRTWEAEREQERLLEDIALVKAAEEKLTKEGIILVKNHGATMLFGNGVPDSSHGVDGQGWLDWQTLDVYLKVNGQWELVNSLASEASAGPSGSPGADGADGADGAPGSVWFEGTGVPSAGLGIDGDFYLDDATGDVYQKVGGTWGIVANIQGADGADGAPGSVWFEGTGPPAAGLGIDGDFYLDDANGDVYQKAAGVWSVVANILGPTGPAGADGADGQGVPIGGSTDEYLAKINGTDFNTEWRPFQLLKLLRLDAGTSVQSFVGTIVIPWTFITINVGGPWISVDSSTEMTILEDGIYMLGFHIDVGTFSSTMTESTVRIAARWQRDNGTGFASIGHNVQIAEDSEFMFNQTLTVAFPQQLFNGDVLRVQLQKVAGDDMLQIFQRNTLMWIHKLEPAGPPVV